MLPVTSREYKQVLRRERFTSGMQAVSEFWQAFKELAAPWAKVRGELQADCGELREIVFFDTPDRDLYRHDCIFRRRRLLSGARVELTFKRRTFDRYLSAETNVRPAKRFKGKPKFEEDITGTVLHVPPRAASDIKFSGRYSHSGDARFGRNSQDWQADSLTWATLTKVFPGAKQIEELAHLPPDCVLSPVRELRPIELVFKGDQLRLPGGVKGEVALICWWSPDEHALSMVEFSFRFGNKRENFALKTVDHAWKLQTALTLSCWSDPESATKTQYIYEGETRRGGATAPPAGP